MLKEAKDISDGIGAPDWRLTLCLFISWTVTFAVCAKGVQTSGKASYFLAIFPFIILAALLIRAVTLEGSREGILYFVQPQWSKLADAKVWYAAVTQCFFSLNIGFGSVTMYASYNQFEHNVYRDALVVTTLDTFTSFFSGLIIFGILGNLAFKMDVDISEVVKSGGTGLAFISYPEAIARFEAVPWVRPQIISRFEALLTRLFAVVRDSVLHHAVYAWGGQFGGVAGLCVHRHHRLLQPAPSMACIAGRRYLWVHCGTRLCDAGNTFLKKYTGNGILMKI